MAKLRTVALGCLATLVTDNDSDVQFFAAQLRTSSAGLLLQIGLTFGLGPVYHSTGVLLRVRLTSDEDVQLFAAQALAGYQ